MSDKEHKRDNSFGADIRHRQDDAARASRRTNESSGSTGNGGITDQNADEFVRNSVLDLEAIAKQVAAENATKDKED